MKLGIIGLPQSGKTTLFNALTRSNQPLAMSAGRFEVHTGVVDVPDPRVDKLSDMFKPRKTIYAKVTYADIAGLESGAAKVGFPGPLLNQLSQMEAFIQVVRVFENAGVPVAGGSVNPQRDLESLESEFILNDLIMVERKLERLTEERKKGGGRDKGLLERETALFQHFHSVLSQNLPLRTQELDAEAQKIVSGFGFLSLKPMLIVLNLSEGQTAPQITYNPAHCQHLALQCRLEMDLAQLSPEDAAMFMQEYGVEELSLSKVIARSYDLLGVQSFFTVGEDEVRAWTIRRGANAVEAAGAIHSDLAKGFIRAETVSYHDLVTLGSIAEARSKGKLRLEGKEYLVQDGDIVHIRFNL